MCTVNNLIFVVAYNNICMVAYLSVQPRCSGLLGRVHWRHAATVVMYACISDRPCAPAGCEPEADVLDRHATSGSETSKHTSAQNTSCLLLEMLGSRMVRKWFAHGSQMVREWFGCGPDSGHRSKPFRQEWQYSMEEEQHSRFPNGSGMVRKGLANGSHMVRKWLV